MSLIICVFVPTGIVISGDSRTTLTVSQQIQNPNNPNAQITVQSNYVMSDSAEKLFVLHKRYGVGAFGDAIINNLPISYYMEQFQAQNPNAPQNTNALSSSLLNYFRTIGPIPNIGCIVAGYDGQTPWIDSLNVQAAAITRNNVDPNGNVVYAVVSGGDIPVVGRLLSQPQFNPPFAGMNIQDAVDFSRHLIRSTIDQMRFEPRQATVGGPIDTLAVTPREACFLAQKTLTPR